MAINLYPVSSSSSSSDITSVIPGVAATNLGKAEDAAHASGDTGVLLLAVRADTAAALSSTTGYYTGLIVDSLNHLWSREGFAPVAEDNSNGVIGIANKPLAVNTYCPDMDTSTALEASSVTKSSAGVLYGFSASNTNATGHWIQFFNSTTLPADTTVPVLEFAIGAEGTTSQEWPKGRYFSTGIVWCISSTNGAKTIAGATALVDVHFK